MSSRRDIDTVTVMISGEIDLATAEQLHHEIATHVESRHVAAVLLDFAGVTFIDSAGINTLLVGRRLADEHGKGYRVINAATLVRDLLEMTGVWSHLTGRAG